MNHPRANSPLAPRTVAIIEYRPEYVDADTLPENADRPSHRDRMPRGLEVCATRPARRISAVKCDPRIDLTKANSIEARA